MVSRKHPSISGLHTGASEGAKTAHGKTLLCAWPGFGASASVPFTQEGEAGSWR